MSDVDVVVLNMSAATEFILYSTRHVSRIGNIDW
jgi:hypothetical protein